MLRAAYGLEQPAHDRGRPARPARLPGGAASSSTSSRAGSSSAASSRAEELVGSLERAPVRSGGVRPGHVAIVDLLRARTRRAAGRVRARPRGGRVPAAHAELAVPRRRPPPRARRPMRGWRGPIRCRGRATSSTRRARDRRGGSTWCARRRPTTARRASRARSGRTSAPYCGPEDVPRVTRRRDLSELVWPIEARPQRARAAAGGRVAVDQRSRTRPRRSRSRTAGSGGWTARSTPSRRPTQLPIRPCSSRCARSATFGATELEAFAGCSSIWFVERMLDPKSMDVEVDARMRGSIAHQALFSFFSGLPKRLGTEQVPPEQLDDALEFLRECLGDAITGGARDAARADRPPAQRAAPGRSGAT